jgi:protein farnesyltransferase/geranylgeranyltransferase type-1 subunit alpha
MLIEWIVEEGCEGNYAAWSYKQNCLDSRLLADELEYIRRYTIDTPKNYQLWQHRSVVVARMHSCGELNIGEELESVADELKENPKNYHAWQYRQHLLQTYPFDRETESRFVLECLRRDSWNNSAWNHAVFLSKCMGIFLSWLSEFKEHCIKHEIGSDNQAMKIAIAAIEGTK